MQELPSSIPVLQFETFEEPKNPMIAVQSPFEGGPWPDMSTTHLRAQFDHQHHKRGSSASSVNSYGPPSPYTLNLNVQPRIASEAEFPRSRFDFDFPVGKSLQTPPDGMLYAHANTNFGGIDMTRMASDQGGSTPVTPQTWDADSTFGDERHFNTNAYWRSMQDVFPNQSTHYASNNSNQQTVNMSSARRSMQQQVQAAHKRLRTESPTSNPRNSSPFKATSDYIERVQPVRQQQQPTLKTQRTSVSPKDLLLDDHDIDGNAPSLFNDQSRFNDFKQQSSFYNMPSLNMEPSVQIEQSYPFESLSSQQIPDSTPDFPAHLISMESTHEEGPSEPSSQSSQTQRRPYIQPRIKVEPPQHPRPDDVSTEPDTYSCTYHGCPQRFDSPAKLQRHKREGHRTQDQTGSSQVNIALRNSQAGPHRCDRINPQTGKPCNSVFSRPYDLTRHEDTIHNGRKLKVRCHLCTDEKTFSRNDALTRHMRVVHPDVDWVGKQKRRSPNTKSNSR